MRRLVVFIAIVCCLCTGCTTSPWFPTKEKLADDVGAPPTHFEHLAGRGTGVTDRAKEIENRLGYR